MKKVALVGIGGMGFVHYNAYKKLANAKIIAVADPRTEMAKEKIGEDDVKVYASLEELLENESPDMVDVCTPSYMHADLSIYAMEHGCDVICEKPMSVTVEDTERIIEAMERTGRTFMVAHVVRFMARYVYLKKVIDSGELGRPVHIQMKRISAVPRWSWENWMRDVEKSGGAAIDLSIHDIDFAQYAFGTPKSISAVHHEMKEDNDYLVSNLVYDGFTVSIIGGWYSADIPFNASYTAIFENGIVISDGAMFTKNGEPIEVEVGEVSENTGINLSGADGYADEIAYFVDCLERGEKPERVTPASSQNSVRLTHELMSKAAVV